MQLDCKLFGGVAAYYRPNTSDEFVLDEVIEQRIYRKKRIGFDVEKGEQWLDLGANIGAFAIYCRIKGAKALCVEPDPDCFEILKLNAPSPDFSRWNTAITTSKESAIPFWKGKLTNNFSKATAVSSKGLPTHPNGELNNTHAEVFNGSFYDGIKMDIEGSERDLIDQWLLPKCNKLVMEYHSSRDRSVENLTRRLEILKSKFKVVSYPPEYDRVIRDHGNSYKTDYLTYFDRMIFCKDPK